MEVVAVAGAVIAVPSLMGWLCCRNPNPILVTSSSKPSPSLEEQKLDKVSELTISDEAIIYDKTETRTHDSGSVLTVKVEVHSSSSGAGSDENMSSSDLSERGSGSGAGGEHDYEDIYLVRTEAGKPRSRSRDSGSHSRSASLSSTHSNVVITETITQPELPLPNGSIATQTPQVAEIKSCEDHSQCGKAKLNHSHSMPYQPANNRALKRVASEPGSALPPPPPPPPPDDLSLPSSPEHSLHSVRPESSHKNPGSESPSSQASSADSSSVEEASTLRASSASPTDSADTATTESAPVPVAVPVPEPPHAGPNLVNKQMVLPFIPPKFPNSSDGDEHSLIKPSEYLRALGNKPAAPPVVINKPEPLPAVHTFQPEDKTGAAVVTAGPPPPPMPENPLAAAPTSRKADQPLGTISIQDLNSVQLRRTNKALSKTMSAPLTSLTGTVEGPFQVAKQDLIEELKKSKDITGIKKMKVEKVKLEEQHEKELVTEIAKHLSVDSFVEKIPEKDGTGNPIPPWKRQMLAKKAAEKARKEMEEELAREAEERRLQSIPAWKRQLMQSKKVDEKLPTTYSTPIIDDKKPILNVDIIEKNTLNLTKENKENNKPQPVAVHKENVQATQTKEEETTQIMPWRAQLRKTNSTLNLLE